MGKFVKKELDTIKKLATQEIPTLVSQGCTEEVYNQKRAELNVHIIQMCVGGELVDTKKGQKFRFNHMMPTMSQIAEAAEVINTFIATVENPYLDGLYVDGNTDADDLEIPVSEIMVANVPKFAKVNNKAIREAVLGKAGAPLYQLKLTGLDICTLAAAGEKARKKQNLTIALIVAGVAVTVTAVGVGGYIYCKSKKDQKMEDDIADEIADETVEVDDIDDDVIDDVEIDDVDVDVA